MATRGKDRVLEAVARAVRGAPDPTADVAAFRGVAKSPRIPDDACVVRAGLPPDGVAGVQAAWSEITVQTATGRAVLAPVGDVNGFMAMDDSHYDVIREVECEVEPVLGPDAGADFFDER